MFAKTALIATIAVAAQALTLQATAAAKMDFGDDLFLGDEASFEAAMAAREKFVNEQKALNEKRGAAVKFYFNAKDIAA